MDRKRNAPTGADRAGTIDHDPAPLPGDPESELKFPSRNPTRGRAIEDPNPHRKNRADDEIDGADEDDDATGEMDAAGQDLGLVADDEREAASIEDARVREDDDGDGEAEARGQFD